MKVGDIDIKWDMGYEAAADLLEAVQFVCGSERHRSMENELFTVSKREDGTVVVEIKPDFYRI